MIYLPEENDGDAERVEVDGEKGWLITGKILVPDGVELSKIDGEFYDLRSDMIREFKRVRGEQ